MVAKSSFAACLFILAAVPVCADSPVDRSQPLEKTKPTYDLADGPAWDGSGRLFVPDVRGQKLYVVSAKDNQRRPLSVPAARFSASYFNLGKLYLSDNGNGRIDILRQGRVSTMTKFDEQIKPPIRPNDLVVDNRGGAYVTLTRQNQVVYISPNGNQQVAVSSIKSPNGIILSPDGLTLYVSAYAPKEIWSYSVKSPGVTVDQHLFAKMDDGPAKGADGMSIDRAGNVYCAGATDVWIWSASGKRLDKIRTPTRPINCTFGDRDMRSLYITCFDGVYRQRMNAYGRSPHPSPAKVPRDANARRPSTTIPATVRADLDVVYAEVGSRRLLMDVFAPTGDAEEPRPAVVVVHGGGWLNGDKTKFRALAVELAKRGFVTAAIEYRLGHEARFPAGIQDCNAAVRFLRTHAKRWNLAPRKIGAVGGSAGGHLVGLMATAADEKRLQGNGGNPGQSSRLQAAVVMAGPLQIASGSVARKSRQDPKNSNANKWLGKTIDEAPKLYKLCDAYEHVSKDDPPILFMAGEHDFPARNQPTRDRLKALGIATDIKVYKDGKHGCWNQLPWFHQMAEDIDKFLRAHLDK